MFLHNLKTFKLNHEIKNPLKTYCLSRAENSIQSSCNILAEKCVFKTNLKS